MKVSNRPARLSHSRDRKSCSAPACGSAAEYEDANLPLAVKRLSQAGMRLSEVLNACLSPEEKKAIPAPTSAEKSKRLLCLHHRLLAFGEILADGSRQFGTSQARSITGVAGGLGTGDFVTALKLREIPRRLCRRTLTARLVGLRSSRQAMLEGPLAKNLLPKLGNRIPDDRTAHMQGISSASLRPCRPSTARLAHW